MKPTRHFGKLRRTGTQRLRKIRKTARGAVTPYSQSHDKELAWATIELANLWSEFCRAYILSCLRSAKLDSGGRVSCNNVAAGTTFDQAIVTLAQNMGKGWAVKGGKIQRKHEPNWNETSCFLKSCNQLGASHLSTVQKALSMGPAVFRNLSTCRNFYAHRSEDTARKVMNLGLTIYSIGGKTHPSEVLAARAARSRQSLILDFIDETEMTIDQLC